jgi:hypothetical protein
MSIFSRNVRTLNIESDNIRILSARGNKVNKWGEVQVPPGLIKSTLINDPVQVASLISGLFKEVGMSRSNVSVAVSDFRSVSRFVTLPGMKSGKVEEAVMWTAERELPVPLDTLYISWQVLERTGDEQRVFILGIPRNAFDQLVKTLWIAGISTRAIDCKPIALGRLVDRDDAVIVDLENETISIVLKVKGTPVVMHTVLVNPENTLFEDRIQRLVDDLFRTVEYFNSGSHGQQVGPEVPLYLTGSLVNDGIPEQVRASLDREVLTPEIPFDLPGDIPVTGYAVNIGLVLRELKSGKMKQQAGISTLRPDIRKAKRFNI